MARLFSSDVIAIFSHILKNITVADLCLFHMDALFLPHKGKSEVRHDCDYDRIFLQSSFGLHVVATDCHDLIAVHNISMLIHRKHTVCVTVKRKTNCCLFIYNTRFQLIHMSGATIGIDVGSIRISMDCDKICSKICQCFDRCIMGCAFCAVYNNFHTFKIHRNTFFHEFHVFISQVKAVINLSYARTDRKYHVFHVIFDQSLNLIFHLIRKLVALSIEELDPIKFHWIV